MQSYITVCGTSTAEYTEKHSRFIATVFNCESEEQANRIIASQKSKYWDAKHNVYAYVLQNGTVRFSDDGEPHATAGKPVLDVIKGSKITNVLITVTRYFGGVLLGTGGLVRAYSTSAKDALSSAEKVQMCACTKYAIKCEYTNYDRLLKLITDLGGTLQGTDFSDKVKIEFIFKDSDCEKFCNRLCETFAGSIKAEECEKLFFSVKL